MKALLQRVTRASVSVEGKITGDIKQGLVILLGVAGDDTEKDADYLAEKIANLRIFSDADSKFNLSAVQVNAGILVISQFTLLADTRKGRRPSFTLAALPHKAEALYNYFLVKIRQTGLTVETGSFGAHMIVEIINDGPVTVMLDSKEKLA